jgi:hypothetical protein
MRRQPLPIALPVPSAPALEARAHAHPTMILALHAKNTANIARVAAVSTLSKAYFIAGPRFRAPPSKGILIPRESGHRVSMKASNRN